MIKEFKLWEGTMPLYEADKPCENRITAYLHEDDTLRPAIVIYPGGGYVCHGECEQHPIAECYYKLGYQAFIVYYRVAPYHHPAPLMDAQRGVRLVRYHAKEWGVDPAKVFTVGFSAGGHLCGCVASMEAVCHDHTDPVDGMDARPTGAILAYPVVTADPTIGHVGSFQDLLGERMEELRDTLSLENLVGENTCPCFVWHTVWDNCVNVENSLRYFRAMKAAGRPVELHLFAEGDHGSGTSEALPGTCQWPALSVNWMKRISE